MDELDEQLQFPVEQAVADGLARDMTPDEARRAARPPARRTAARAATRVRGGRRRELAVGIGSVVAIVNAANWLPWRPLPGVDEERPPGAPAVAVVSERIGRAFGDAPLVGRAIHVNGQPVLVRAWPSDR